MVTDLTTSIVASIVTSDKELPLRDDVHRSALCLQLSVYVCAYAVTRQAITQQDARYLRRLPWTFRTKVGQLPWMYDFKAYCSNSTFIHDQRPLASLLLIASGSQCSMPSLYIMVTRLVHCMQHCVDSSANS